MRIALAVFSGTMVMLYPKKKIQPQPQQYRIELTSTSIWRRGGVMITISDGSTYLIKKEFKTILSVTLDIKAFDVDYPDGEINLVFARAPK